MGRDFLNYFRFVNVYYVNLLHLQEFHIRGKLIPNSIYKKQNPTTLYLSFRVKLMVFMALTNCFRKNFYMIFKNFAFTCYLFVAQWRIVPSQKSICS